MRHSSHMHLPGCRDAPAPKRVVDDYLGDMDLPSSESESDGEAPVAREEKKETVRISQAKFSLLPAVAAGVTGHWSLTLSARTGREPASSSAGPLGR